MTYDQPFCTIGSTGEFRGVSHGYLPPLEEPEPVTKERDVASDYEALDKRINQILSIVTYNQNRINEHIDKAKKSAAKKKQDVKIDF